MIALSLVYFTVKYLPQRFYQSSPELVFAYAIMFFPLALVAVRAGVAQAPPGLEEVARSLGHSRLSVLARVTLPILAPALVARILARLHVLLDRADGDADPPPDRG